MDTISNASKEICDLSKIATASSQKHWRKSQKPTPEKIGSKIRNYRQDKDLTQRELAESTAELIDPDDYNWLGERIAQLRKQCRSDEKPMTQEKISEKVSKILSMVGVTGLSGKASASKVERSKRGLSALELVAFAIALDVPISDLIPQKLAVLLQVNNPLQGFQLAASDGDILQYWNPVTSRLATLHVDRRVGLTPIAIAENCLAIHSHH